MEIGLSILSGFILVIVLTSIFMGFQQVPQGYNYTVERFGQYIRTLEAGPRIIMPFIESVGHRVDMREQVLAVPSQEVITLDNASVKVNGVIFFYVKSAPEAAYAVVNYQDAILNLITTNIRGAVGSMELDDLLSKREEISESILSDVDHATQPWGVKVLRVKIRDIDPPESLAAAMTKQLTAEREKRAAVFTAEGERQSAIMKAQGEKEAEILRAEGEKQAEILRAEGQQMAAGLQAQAREHLAKAEARATAWMSEAIDKGNVQSVNYFVAEKYVEALKELATAKNQKVIMLPLEATSLTGLLQGIKSLTQEAFNNPDNNPRGGA